MHDYDKSGKIEVGEITKQRDLPIYTCFSTIEFIYPKVGREYEIGYWSYDGEEREFDKEFEATLIAARQYDSFSEVEPVTLAYVTDDHRPDEAEAKIQKYIDSGEDLLLLVFLRTDNAKQFVMNGEVNI